MFSYHFTVKHSFVENGMFTIHFTRKCDLIGNCLTVLQPSSQICVLMGEKIIGVKACNNCCRTFYMIDTMCMMLYECIHKPDKMCNL